MEELIKQYELYRDNYDKYYKNNKKKLETILNIDNVLIHSFKGRIKTISSISEKYKKRKTQLKKDIRNMNDIVAFRLILYNNDDKRKFYKIIENNYDIIDNYSKVNSTDDDELILFNTDFYIVKNKRNYKNYKNFKFELQITTLIESVITDFGHDIFYKDLNNLKMKNELAYKKISDSYIEAIKLARALETKLRLISIEANKIVINDNKINSIISHEFDEKIENCNSNYDYYEILNTLIESSSEWTPENIEQLQYKERLEKIINSLNKLDHSNQENLLCSTDLIFCKLLEMLERFIYINYSELDYIFEITNKYYEQGKINERDYNKFLINLIKIDYQKGTVILREQIFKWLNKTWVLISIN